MIYKRAKMEVSKEKFKYFCEFCDFKSNKKYSYDRHQKTQKHKEKVALFALNEGANKMKQKYQTIQVCINDDVSGQNKSKNAKIQGDCVTPKKSKKEYITKYRCCCGKEFKHRSNLYRHMNTCSVILKMKTEGEEIEYSDDEIEENTVKQEPISNSINDIDNEDISTMKGMFMQLVKQNQELQEALTIQNEKMMEMAKEPKTINNYNTQNNYNIINVLNTKYKDAMTIDDFLASLEVTIDDLHRVRDQGFLHGVGARLVKELKDMPEEDRPVHFSKKRLKEYFTKAMEGWVRDTKDNENLNYLIKGATNKHIEKLIQYKNDIPEIIGSEDEYKNYQKTMMNIYKGLYDDDESKQIKNKIYKKLETLKLESLFTE